jgi:L-glyceraldehyde 3-phosphate reductase
MLSEDTLAKVRGLNAIAHERGQTLAQMALAWTLRDRRVTSALIGASSVGQLEENLRSLQQPTFSADELAQIDRFATDSSINIWTERAQAE